MTDLHLLHVIDGIGASGGAERSLASMASELSDRGIELDIAYLAPRTGLRDELEASGARLFSLVGRGGLAGWTWRLRRLVAERRPDLIHTTLFNSDVAGRTSAMLTRVPVVSTLAGVPYDLRRNMDPTVARWKIRAARELDRVTARAVRRFHAVTEHVADVMSERLRVSRDRIEVIPRGRDARRLGVRTPERRALVRRRLEIDESDPVLLVVSRHEYQKGVDVAIEALPSIIRATPRAHLLVAGRPGKLTPRLREATRRLGVEGSVSFLGTRDDVPDLLCAADVFVLPSRWEGIGGVLLEAMALETPIVASDIPPVREVIGTSGGGVLVPVEDPESLADGVVGVVSDREKAVRSARLAHERFVSEFSIEIITDRMITFYEKALS
jgi:glycosyltransferase involved in cell wall biosynthesis